ncbi:MAG TPA: hypothetical protein VH281_04805 [Gaiellaceae bacterium]
MALVCLFGGAIVYGGNAIGAWDPLPPAPKPPPAVKISHVKDKPPKSQPPSKPAAAPRRTPAQKAWLVKANALCRESQVDVQKVVSSGDTATMAGVLDLFARVKKLDATLNDRFLALGAPVGYKDDIARVRALFAKEERYFDSMYRALEHGDQNTFYTLSGRLTDVALDESDVLASLGADDCDVDLLSSFG